MSSAPKYPRKSKECDHSKVADLSARSPGVISSIFMDPGVPFQSSLDRRSVKTMSPIRTRTITCVYLLVCLGCGYGQFSNNRFAPSPKTQSGSCPERNGRTPHPSQCDAYTECQDGVAEEKLCPDGLVFNADGRFFAYPCQYPVEVDCTGRTGLQPARPTEDCPHSYGYFKLGDEANCGQFLNCVEGRGYKFDCPEGLAFNEATLQCDWPDQVPTCNAEEYLGFSCPEPEGTFSAPEFRSFRNPSDCSKFFVCVNNKPRLLSCAEGQGFNEETGTCEDAENVPGCIFHSSPEPLGPPSRTRGRK